MRLLRRAKSPTSTIARPSGDGPASHKKADHLATTAGTLSATLLCDEAFGSLKNSTRQLGQAADARNSCPENRDRHPAYLPGRSNSTDFGWSG
ncbi:hypothetical protein, partial [Streptomyces sp. CB02959]|uniref:hypothetical protein n=1 Tax=Streptomyces sp. CB02959 TaxID=2020330 RepID=UPI001C610E1A